MPPTPPARTCARHEKQLHAPRSGGSVEYITGWQSSGSPVEGYASGFGLDLRRRLARRLALIARLDVTYGRDAGADRDGDGRDDAGTGAVNRVSALGGATITLASTYHDDFIRFIELDLLGGYLATTTQPGEDGPVVAADISFQLVVPRFGVRVLQGVGAAREARAVLAHLGLTIGGSPTFAVRVGCGGGYPHQDRGSSPWAVGVDIPLGGYALVGGLGFVTPGLAVEAAYHANPYIQAVARADVLAFTNGNADRVVHQSLFAGGRIDLAPIDRAASHPSSVGGTIVVLAGYAFASATKPTGAGSGPVLDASIGFGGQAPHSAGGLRIHGRFGLGRDNTDLRAIFLSAGGELRLDARRWGLRH